MNLALVALLASGCFSQATVGVTSTDQGVRGGAAEVAIGDAAYRVTAQLSAGELVRDDRSTTFGAGFDEGLRFSLPGVISRQADELRWLDLGVDAGAGAGGSGAGAFARAFAGGWADVRVLPRHERYPTIRAQLRRIAYAGGIANETELLLGVGWTARDPNVQLHFH